MGYKMVGGGARFWVVLTQELQVLAILNGGAKCFHSLKGGLEKMYPVLRGAQNVAPFPRK